MGGNALKNTFTRRHDRDEYFVKENEVFDILIKETGVYPMRIPAYHTKESFGDMDILYTGRRALTELDVRRIFKPNEIYKNGTVISFDYREIQVDLIYTPEESAQYANAYFSHNDLGNFIGRLAKKFDLKHGHDGLWLPVKDGDYGIADICVTRNHNQTLEFLGLDIQKFQDGFDTLEDIFKYVATSPVFNPSIYLFENVNAVSRIRDKKRASYNSLLKWCADNDATLPKNPSIEKWEGRQRVFDYFGDHVHEEYTKALAKVAFNRAVKEKFNGDIVSQLTLTENAELGELMKKLKSHPYFSYSNLFTENPSNIADMIRKVYSELRKGSES